MESDSICIRMIPKRIHQIWCGPQPIPARELAWCKQMKEMNPDFVVSLYGNEIFERYGDDPYVKELISRNEPWAFVTDRLRCLLLRDEGGIWLDPDCQPMRPLSRLDHIWNDERIAFVHSMRDPLRTNVHLHRGITLADNTFLASAPNGRMINRVLEAWTPQSIVIDGHSTGVQILKYTDYDVCCLNYRYFYDLQVTPDCLVLHDGHNAATWVAEHKARKERMVA